MSGHYPGPAVTNNDRTVSDSRKQAVSIRMNRSDVRNIKRLAERLGARDSDVIRFAIKLMLAQLAPLQDPGVGGRGLVPVFLESGPELMRHFELDAARIASIINDGVEAGAQVDRDDIQLLAMSALQRSYLKMRAGGSRRAAPSDDPTGNGLNGLHGVNEGIDHLAAGEAPEATLRQYLYDKYLHSAVPGYKPGPRADT
jgi:hypothetical protein